MSDALKTLILDADTVPELLRGTSANWPANELAVADNERITYRQADRESAAIARRLLAAGAGKGSHIGILFPNDRRFIVSFLAISRIGAVAVPLSTFSTSSELLHILRHADIHCLLMSPGFLGHNYIDYIEQALPSLTPTPLQQLPEAPFLRRLFTWGGATAPPWAVAIEDRALAAVPHAVLESAESEVHSSDAAAIVYTSGCTSAPKGVIHSQRSLLRQAARQAGEKQYTASDRIFSSMPFFWVGGLSYTLLAAMQAGATVLGCKSSLPRDCLDFIERESATWFLGWPHAALALESDPSFAGRKLNLRGGYLFGALPENQRPASPEAICNSLGMTETAGPHSCGHLGALPGHLHGSFGRAAAGMEYRVVDLDSGEDVPDGEPGELLVRGDTLMLGMHKREADRVFTADGWYPTRDLVIRREGHIFFQGRCDDVVKIRGANVSPREVEEALNTIPNVTQSLVTGVAAEHEAFLGAVVITPPGATIDLDALPGLLRNRLSAYKVPTVYAALPVDKLPMLSSGKIDRLALIQLLRDTAMASGS